MFKNYFKIAVRNLVKHKSFSLLNIFGLAVGMASSILIFLWVQDELSYDRFNTNASSIYRITAKVSDVNAAVSGIPVAEGIKSGIAEIEATVRLKATQGLFTVSDKKFEEKKVFFADSNFLQVFTYPLLFGDVHTVLSRPDGILITEATAKKYFGEANVIGKLIRISNIIPTQDLAVTGVLKNVPSNSHLQFDIVLPMALYKMTSDYDPTWSNFDLYTYIMLNKHYMTRAHNLGGLEEHINKIYEKNDNTHTQCHFSVQPLTAIHLHSHYLLDVEGQGDIQYVHIFSLVAIFILVIACINFMNLSTAMSSRRTKEVGLRKTIGAIKSQLILQFLGEALLLSFLALLLGLALAYLLLPFFNDIADKTIAIDLLNIKIIVALFGTVVVVGLFSGSYPALFLSAFPAVTILKGFKNSTGQKSVSLRNGLVIVQFIISNILIVSTLVVYNQLQFIHNRDIGFDKDNLLYVKMPQVGNGSNITEALRAMLSQHPELGNYTFISHLPTYLTTGTTDVKWEGKDSQAQIVFPHMTVDENFTKAFNMHMLQGRFFTKNFKGDEKNYVVNETALRMMKLNRSSVIGKQISVNGNKGEIIGIVKDFNFKPIHQSIEPLILKTNGWTRDFLVIRTKPNDVQKVIEQTKTILKNLNPNSSFAYGFIDEDLSNLYRSEQQMGTLFNIFSLLSIIISCLGLFGLATFAIHMRLKEIGVRKVLGASVTSIMNLLSKDFLKLIVIAFVIATPVAWFIMNKWLQGFAYRIRISWWVFAIAGSTAMIIALFTISFQTIKAALSNPVKSLRTE